jgi:hypothetical protein
MPKNEKNELMRDLRKKGVKALTKKLGIDDPEIDRMVAEMIRTGETTDADELIKRITEIQVKKKMDAEAKELSAQGPPPELLETTAESEVIPTLPGANPKRKTLKPLQRTLNSAGPCNFDEWLQQGIGTNASTEKSVISK